MMWILGIEVNQNKSTNGQINYLNQTTTNFTKPLKSKLEDPSSTNIQR